MTASEDCIKYIDSIHELLDSSGVLQLESASMDLIDRVALLIKQRDLLEAENAKLRYKIEEWKHDWSMLCDDTMRLY